MNEQVFVVTWEIKGLKCGYGKSKVYTGRRISDVVKPCIINAVQKITSQMLKCVLGSNLLL